MIRGVAVRQVGLDRLIKMIKEKGSKRLLSHTWSGAYTFLYLNSPSYYDLQKDS